MTFAATITVPEERPDVSRAIWEQLIQDGFTDAELKVPPLASAHFAVLINDSRSFAEEVKDHEKPSWPLRCERWLNRLSTMMTGQMFWELPMSKRRAICHAAATLAGRPEIAA